MKFFANNALQERSLFASGMVLLGMVSINQLTVDRCRDIASASASTRYVAPPSISMPPRSEGGGVPADGASSTFSRRYLRSRILYQLILGTGVTWDMEPAARITDEDDRCITRGLDRALIHEIATLGKVPGRSDT